MLENMSDDELLKIKASHSRLLAEEGEERERRRG
jgi:hypothetical protein